MNLIHQRFFFWRTFFVVSCFFFLEPSSLGSTHRPVFRCDATGANFGEDVLAFSFRVTSVGCALTTEPENSCQSVKVTTSNDTECNNYFAVVPRGNCSFSEKAFYAQTSTPVQFGALIVYNDIHMEPVPMSGARFSDKVFIPVVMVDYECMQGLIHRYNYNDGYVVTIKVTPGYYDLIKYLVPFGAVISFCLIVLLISLIIRVCRERRRLARKRLSRSNLKKLPLVKFKKGIGMYETCAVCLEDFEEGEKLRQLPCKHAYHTKCIDPWLTKNRKVCPVCKRKVGPSNHSDSSDSESERPPPSTTTSMMSHSGSNAAVIASTTGSSSRDSVPLLRYEQPMAFGSAGDINYPRGNSATSIPSRPFRSPGFLNLARINSEASGMPPPQRIRPSSIEDSSSSPQTPEDEVMHISNDIEQDGRRGVPRFFGRVRNFIRRVTNTELNPHTILDNDFASVSEEDIENSSNNVIVQQPIVTSMMSASDRNVILEPLPPQLLTLERRPSEDSEVEVIDDPSFDDTNNSSPISNTPTRPMTPPPVDPTLPI
uniref:RING-type domain-containing protein n=1 Tax=Panagrolaimus superbus TaxID=310955 RepID=A0A914Y9Z9_9BILA